MKKTKKFFDQNLLNKGYGNLINNQDRIVEKKDYKNILPPIDVIEQYEELFPGTFDKLLEMSSQEQSHKHSTELLRIEKYNKTIFYGRVFALILLLIIGIFTIILAMNKYIFLSGLFFTSAFTCIIMCSYFYTKNVNRKNIKKPNVKTKNYSRKPSHKQFP